jgi:hypothetical protein
VRRAILPIVLLLALGIAAAPAVAVTWVGYPALLEQVRSGPVVRAVINRGPAHVEIKFRDLSEWEATYPRSQQPRLLRLLHARQIQVIYATRPRARHTRPAATHHHLRYIAAGLAAVALIAGALYLLARRRRAAPSLGSEPPGR